MEHTDGLSWNIEKKKTIQKQPLESVTSLWLSLSVLHFSCAVFTNLIKGENISTVSLSTHTGNKKTDAELKYSTSGSVAFRLQVLWLPFLIVSEYFFPCTWVRFLNFICSWLSDYNCMGNLISLQSNFRSITQNKKGKQVWDRVRYCSAKESTQGGWHMAVSCTETL